MLSLTVAESSSLSFSTGAPRVFQSYRAAIRRGVSPLIDISPSEEPPMGSEMPMQRKLRIITSPLTTEHLPSLRSHFANCATAHNSSDVPSLSLRSNSLSISLSRSLNGRLMETSIGSRESPAMCQMSWVGRYLQCCLIFPFFLFNHTRI